MHASHPSIAIVGATGVVGREALRILESWGVPSTRVGVFASASSAGIELPYANSFVRVRAWSPSALGQTSVDVLCVTSDLSRRIVSELEGAATQIIDASSAFRMHGGVPLVIPEVNPGALAGEPRLIASPNCSTILLLTALEPLRHAFGVRGITLSTYQAVSGAGRAGLDELRAQTTSVLDGGRSSPRAFPAPIAFNCFSHESAVDPQTGLNGEEQKIIDETRKIWNDDRAPINPTCVRVPVERAHSESVSVTLDRPATREEVRRALQGAPGVRVIDERSAGRFPTPLLAAGCDEVLVGRVRPSPGRRPDPDGRSRSYSLWLCGDQLRKGAALNALQLACLACPSVIERAGACAI